MSPAELASYRGKLLALRDRLARDVSSLADEALNSEDEASGNLSHVPIHMADLGTYEREFTLGLLENEEQALEEIAAALGRIERGTFGHCEGCRKAIPKDRLHALPYARYCFECARSSQA
jgi:RNA polymerase-binding transcription factor DksA